jgi:MraZ protein
VEICGNKWKNTLTFVPIIKNKRMSAGSGGPITVSIDPKGRMRLPSRLVERLGADQRSIVVNKGYDGNINIHTLEAWERFEGRTAKLDANNPMVRMHNRLFVADSAELELDDQNRVLVPKRYLQFAEVEKEALILMYNDNIELWSEEKMNRISPDENFNLQDLGSQVWNFLAPVEPKADA